MIAGNAPVAVRATLAALDDHLRTGDDLGWELTARADAAVAASADLREGIDAFLQKREPRWQGR